MNIMDISEVLEKIEKYLESKHKLEAERPTCYEDFDYYDIIKKTETLKEEAKKSLDSYIDWRIYLAFQKFDIKPKGSI